MINVAILDDHPAVLAGLRRLIEAEPDLFVAAAAPTAPQLARRLGTVRPDVLVLDFELARGDGLSQCRRVKNRPCPPGVVVYSAYASPALTLAARAAQADALVDKSSPVDELLTAIRLVAAGGTLLPEVPREAYDAAVSRIDDEDLPVLAMLLDREPVTAIADALRCDPSEVAWRAQRIVGRLRPTIRSRAEEHAVVGGPELDRSRRFG
jgi:two-component system, NarL family, response regulator DevR